MRIYGLTAHMKRGLSIAGDVGNYSLEDLGLIRCGAQVGVEILKLDLLAPEVVSKPTKAAALIFLASLIVKLVSFNSLAYKRRVLFQYTAHRERRECVGSAWKIRLQETGSLASFVRSWSEWSCLRYNGTDYVSHDLMRTGLMHGHRS